MHCLKESVRWLENVDRIHLALVSDKLVLQINVERINERKDYNRRSTKEKDNVEKPLEKKNFEFRSQ